MPRWLLWTSLAILAWGIWAVLSKVLGDALPASHSQALSTLGLLPVMAAVLLLPRPAPPPCARPRLGTLCAITAGVFGCLGNLAYYQALSLGGKASTVTPLTALYPIVTVGLALLFLHERLVPLQLCGILLSLLAIYLFNVPTGQELLSPWLAYALLPIASWGLAGFFQKLSTHHLSGESSTFWFLAAFVPVACFLLLQQPWPGPVSNQSWILVSALGLFFGLGNYGLLAAFACHGKAAVITPLSGLYPIVSVPAAILFLDERIGAREWLAIVLALVAVVLLSWEKVESNARPG